MKISRRNFLKSSAAAATIAAINAKSGDVLAKISPKEAGIIKEELKNYKKVFSADAMCPAECGLEFWSKGGNLWKIYGNKDVPMNDGTCCAKAASIPQLVYSPYRIKHPMIRTGERGSGQFKKVSWDEAIDFIAKKLTKIKKEYGAESVMMNTGDVTDRDQYWRLFFAWGTPNCVEHGAICDTPRRHGPKLILGGKRIQPDIMRPLLIRDKKGNLTKNYDYKTKLIIYNGWNPFVSTRIYYENRGTVEAKLKNGCKVVVIDPSYSNTATAADQWLAPRAGTDGDLFGAMLRYIIENDNPNNPDRRYIDWNMKKYVKGWDKFFDEFKSWFNKKDPINNLSYFSLEWASDRTGLTIDQIRNLAHDFGITKPATLVWGMQSPGHHYNGYCASIIGTVLNVITGNFDAPGGAIDTEIVKASKGGSAKGAQFKKRKIKKVINGKEVEGEVEHLHKDAYGDQYPSAWDDVVADIPDRIFKGVNITYGPFKGHKYPFKGYILRTGNSLITASNPEAWKKAFTAKDSNGEYKLELSVVIDSIFLESALYADVILPEASFVERMSLSDIYPSHPVLYLRDEVIKPLYESKKPTEIMNMLAKRLVELGDKDLKGEDFWLKYNSEEDFVNEMLAVSPGKLNVGTPLPYPKYPEGYKILGTPESLEKGEVEIDHKKKVIKGKPLTVEWLRKNKGVAVWPMSYYRYKKVGSDEPNKAFPKTDSKLIEFVWDYEDSGKRKGRYSKYNKRIEESKVIPAGLKEIGLEKFPKTFYWFETIWNPYTNLKYKRFENEYPFQVINGRVHHAMTGTQMATFLSEIKVEGTWQPLNDEIKDITVDVLPGAKYKAKEQVFEKNSYSVGTIWMNEDDAKELNLKTGDLVEIENPLGFSTRGKIFASGGIRPKVIKIAFGTGGRFVKEIGPLYKVKGTTPLANLMTDPNGRSPIMGFPTFADMIARIKKV
ncbi:molybdopterin-dependent oxidoreductase [Deferribacterales bacterium Es71-Z0220]|uniref:molybdopterin-containing oxidoreductase family protein n=1 Tax=Deferrivibrio essentukiensis TaxID=2880922 RepID=UPI001F621A3E|nr:molybdopterin-dependent oxidoreductase [Deferrivibrio essentukiensis]MCB4204887.1 molybdopterin-dependent oxidoreductase [Deferrivibrio essentukiensis]